MKKQFKKIMASNPQCKQHFTRNFMKCAIFGIPCEMSDTLLPTYYSMMKDYLFTKHLLKEQMNSKEPSFSEVAETVSKKVEYIWKKASLPIVSHTRVLQMMRVYHDKYRSLLKPYKSRKDVPSYKNQLQEFEKSSKCTLFDICTCKCKEFSRCSCEKSKRVPSNEQDFLTDQRTDRLMVIGSIDITQTRRLKKKKEHRKEVEKTLLEASQKTSAASSNKAKLQVETETNELQGLEEISEDEEEATTSTQYVTSEQQMRETLPSLAVTCDRFKVSDRAGAAIASAVLTDLRIVTPNDKGKIIDRSKLRRARQKQRNVLQQKGESQTMRGLYFDGRKDKTLIQVQESDGSNHRRTIREEHISIISEPHSVYFAHVTPSSGTARDICTELVNCLKERNVDIRNIVAVGCDSTAVNTGSTGGAIRLLEQAFETPLQWVICLLHLNELPLRHLFYHLDGTTTGPRAFSGDIGRALLNCEKLPIANFKPIEIQENLCEVDTDDISTDQKYLFEIHQAISSGTFSESLQHKSPGNISHSRWLTTANRILLLYASTETPSDNLQTLATFIVKVYAPMWFEIKCKPLCQCGAKHLWQMIARSRYLSEELRRVHDPVIQRNAYYAHQENILIAMINDDKKNVRELGFRRIMKARTCIGKKGKDVLRQFKVPELKFHAKDYTELIKWEDDGQRTEPPITKGVSLDQIKSCIKHGTTLQSELFQFPCHTQAIERCAKLVTEAAGTVCGPSNRDGFIRATLDSRQKMPKFETKADH